MGKKVGRPKNPPKQIEDETLSSYRNDIKIFKNSLTDCLEEPEYSDKKETIERFLALPTYQQNIFIVYLLEGVSILKLANLLGCDRADIFSIIKNTKRELQKK